MEKRALRMFLGDFEIGLKSMTKEDLGELFLFIMDFHLHGDENGIKESLQPTWFMLREHIRRQQAYSAGQSEYGKQGGRPSKGLERVDKGSKGLESSESYSESKSKSNIKKNIKKKEKKFEPPSIESVTKYADSRYVNFGSRVFFDYYEASEWIDSIGNPVKSWKGKVITWAKRDGVKILPPVESARLYDGQCVSCGSMTEIDSINRTCKKCKGL
ncbi:MAG: hypothetical protein DRI69_01825 [Bacteroidetes bacterium]|nr:MAG: hypothetical protein DRI69_01825 [Bacteroidota bacterium]